MKGTWITPRWLVTAATPDGTTTHDVHWDKPREAVQAHYAAKYPDATVTVELVPLMALAPEPEEPTLPAAWTRAEVRRERGPKLDALERIIARMEKP